jgi:hypothetical protein
MSGSWWFAAVAGLTLAAAPAELAAQGRSAEARGQQGRQAEARGNAQARGQAQQDARNSNARANDARQDARSQADVRRAPDPRQAERQRQIERQRQLDRDRLLAERRREEEQRRRAEYDRRYSDRWDDRRYDDRWDDRRYNDRWDDRNRDPWGYHSRARMGNAPAFCRSGAGHPVHGRSWCRDKGYGLGYDRWDRDGWGTIVLRQPRTRQQQLGRGGLIDVLGDVVFRRFEGFGTNYGRGSVTGHWVNEWGGNVLQLSIGGVPFARLVDANGDGRVDRVLLRN